MSDRQELTERLIQLEALSVVVDKITGEVFDRNVEGDWSTVIYPLLDRARAAHGLDPVRVDLVAAHMFAELSIASEWFAAQAREHAERAHDQVVEEVARERG
jgi:hypothetical protein